MKTREGPPFHNSDLNSLRNAKTLIIGEVGSGKTAYTEKILRQMMISRETPVAVIDMAPEAQGRVGGKMNVFALEGILYYTDTIHAPRLTGKTPEEVEQLAAENASRIEGLFAAYLQDPSPTLIINDVSIYLQAGDLERLWALVSASQTAVMNGYYGTSLGEGALSRREKANMEFLRGRCDRVILLKPPA